MGDQPVARPLPTHRTTQIQNKRKQTSMPRVGFEPTIPAFERAKTVHVCDRQDESLVSEINTLLELFQRTNAQLFFHRANFSKIIKIFETKRRLYRSMIFDGQFYLHSEFIKIVPVLN
jgi:hypothetical protein